MLRFYGNRCAHMTVPNSSGVARVSFDFRVLPAALAVQLPEGACAAAAAPWPLAATTSRVAASP